jgi:monoamine oxidase
VSRSLFARLHRRFGDPIPRQERRRQLRNRLDAIRAEYPIRGAIRTEAARKPKARVAIVGGGFAGLMAARELVRTHTVTLLEARNRLGGRVLSLIDEGSKRITEAGAELIGYAHPTWLRLAMEFDLGLTVWTSDDDFDALRLGMPMTLGGHSLSAEKAREVYEEMDIVLKSMERDARQIQDPWKPWLGEAAKLDQIPLSEWISEHAGSDLTRAALEVQFANTNAAPSAHQSYLANLALIAGAAGKRSDEGAMDDFFTMSENVRCARGNQALADALGGEIVQGGGEILLSTAAEKVEIENSPALVTTVAGREIEADFVVLAIPPSMWPRHSSLVVEPEIPQDFYMSMGIAVKYLSDCPTRFWITEKRSPTGSSDTLGMTWEGTDNQMQTPGQDVELTVFAGGRAAVDALAEFRRGGKDALRSFYDARIGELYPAYPANRRVETRFIAWPLEPWTMSGYSCPAPGEVCRVAPHLLEPFHQRLFFAGEHACLPFFGYMEGALQSGTRAANAILQASD